MLVVKMNRLCSRLLFPVLLMVVAMDRQGWSFSEYKAEDLLRSVGLFLIALHLFSKPIDLSFLFVWERRQEKAEALFSGRSELVLALAAFLAIVGSWMV